MSKIRKKKIQESEVIADFTTNCFHCLIMKMGHEMIEDGQMTHKEFYDGIWNAAVEAIVDLAQVQGQTLEDATQTLVDMIPQRIREVESDRLSVSQVRH